MFVDRADAGRRLAEALRPTVAGPDPAIVVVLGLPRGGVVVAAEVGRTLGLAFDVLVVRKVGVPHHRELAMGAIGEGGVRVVNDDVVARAGVSPDAFARIESEERAELERRVVAFRSGRPAPAMAGRCVVIVDDGLATGASARAACQVARAAGAAHVVLAVSVAPADWTARLAGEADAFVCVACPAMFRAVGEFYDDFREVTDAEVVAALTRAD